MRRFPGSEKTTFVDEAAIPSSARSTANQGTLTNADVSLDTGVAETAASYNSANDVPALLAAVTGSALEGMGSYIGGKVPHRSPRVRHLRTRDQ